ncbi:MAG: type II secretion system protein GspL [Sulfuricella sp.]
MAGTDYRKHLQRLSQRLGLGRFLDWWLGELSAMVPRVLSGVSKTTMERRVLVEISGPHVTFSRVAAGKIAEAGRLDMASLDAAGQKLAFQSELNKIVRQKAEIALCLPPEQVLRKKLTLPLAAEENLRQVIAFEMDRHTPFNAEQVYFDYRLASRDKQLEVSLVVAQRAVIDEPLRQLAAWGAQVTAVLVADDVTEDIPSDLLPAGQRQKGKDTRPSRRNIALASGAVVLLCVALALPIWQKRETVLALHPLLGKAYQQAARAEDLRRQLEALMAEYNYLLDKKRESPPVVAVLDDVTRVLPDDTWVQQFDLKGKEMQIQGETASSSKLAGLFEQAKTLHDASFRAPLTKGQGANSERFQLAAETRPLPRAETEPQPQMQPVVAQPAPGQVAAPSEKATATTATAVPAVQEKDQAGKQPSAMPEAAKADSKPAVTKVEPKPISAPAARTGNKP